MKYKDNLSESEAKAEVRKLLVADRKLRKLGSRGNYSKVTYKESFRRGFTLDDRQDKVFYAVFVETINETN